MVVGKQNSLNRTFLFALYELHRKETLNFDKLLKEGV